MVSFNETIAKEILAFGGSNLCVSEAYKIYGSNYKIVDL